MNNHSPSRRAGRKRLWISWLAIIALVSQIPAYGLSVIPRTFEELVQRADLVLVGTVREVRSNFAHGGLDQNTIISDVSFYDLRLVKGQVAGSEYVLQVPGGVVGRFAQNYPGIPSFQTGQRYLVFIRGNRRDFFPVVGINQGVFRIVANDRGQQVVVRDDRIGHAGRRTLSTMRQTAPTLDAFIQKIQDRLAPAAGDERP
jgi:hypothetical protein